MTYLHRFQVLEQSDILFETLFYKDFSDTYAMRIFSLILQE